MANKAIPLIAAGAAAFLLMPKKKKATRGTGKKPSEDGSNSGSSGEEGEISRTGTISGWKYRVRRAKTIAGFSDQYFGEIQAPDSEEWIKAHHDGRTDPEAARLLAMEAIATRLAEANTPEDNLVFASGDMAEGWKWRVMKTVPMPGFADGFFGEIQAADSQEWVRVHNDARTDPEEARLLALEAIGENLSVNN